MNNFNVHPGNKQLVRVTNEDSVKKSIRNIILTNKYERLRNPNLGGSINKFLFEPVGPITEIGLKDAITNTIENYEPRAELVDVKISVYPDENAYAVSIIFYIKTKQTPINLDLTLYRVR